MEPQIKKSYIDTGKAKLVWHDFTWIGDESFQAAQAARCAGAQSNGAFWTYHDYLYNHQRGFNGGQFSTANLKAFATELALDTDAFNACLDRAADIPEIRQQLQEGRTQGITATPFFSINGQRRPGLLTVQQLSTLIEAELARLGR